jgi:hypothetical protein
MKGLSRAHNRCLERPVENCEAVEPLVDEDRSLVPAWRVEG